MTAPQAVKKLHPCLIACVGATIGRPPTYRRSAFSGTVFLQGKRARASNARPYKRFSAVPRRGQDPSLQSKRKNPHQRKRARERQIPPLRTRGKAAITAKLRAGRLAAHNERRQFASKLARAVVCPAGANIVRSTLTTPQCPALTPLYALTLFTPVSSLLTLFRCSPCPKLQRCLHNKRSRLWKKSKQARSAVRPRRKASASATLPCANGCASMNPRVQTALHPGKSPATLLPRKSRPPWRSTSRAGSRCLTSAKSTASAARRTCKSSWKRRRRAASCAATTARPATGAARTPPPRTGKRSCGNAWPTAAITAQLR